MDVIRPQAGPQERFLSSQADIAIYGGAAGGGKTWALLIEPLRHIDNGDFAAVMFRRTFPEIRAPGGMWPESMKIYPFAAAVPNQSEMTWRFNSGAVVKFAHMQHEGDMLNWLGAQVTLIGFDQLERFTEQQFFYMLSRNRSVCGVRPYIRATANPEPGWLADMLAWWIDQDSGYPIAERAGVVRWFIRKDDVIHWADDPRELAAVAPDIPPKSMTFIPAKLDDNRILMEADPGYLANLRALPWIEQERLLGGNWKISSEGGEWPPEYFQSSIYYDTLPDHVQPAVRVMFLDPSMGRDKAKGDYSALVNLTVTSDMHLWVEADLFRLPAEKVAAIAVDRAAVFNPHVFGVESNAFQQLLAVEFRRLAAQRGVMVPVQEVTNSVEKSVRIRRIGPYLAERRLHFRETPGTKMLVQQLRQFPQADHDDGPDALEGAIRVAAERINKRARPPEVSRYRV